ncbi:MAG: NAD-dependent epimerase/dehydratase family protein, partial [Gammaproteobacteria bacterium]
MPGLVAVTGATGFIGQALISSLIRHNWQVRALTRNTPPGNEQISWVKGSLNDEAALEQLVDGAFAVIHCAGRVKGASLDKFIADNATGTANLVRISSTQPSPPRFLLISSLAARKPDLSWYASSKFEG